MLGGSGRASPEHRADAVVDVDVGRLDAHAVQFAGQVARVLPRVVAALGPAPRGADHRVGVVEVVGVVEGVDDALLTVVPLGAAVAVGVDERDEGERAVDVGVHGVPFVRCGVVLLDPALGVDRAEPAVRVEAEAVALLPLPVVGVALLVVAHVLPREIAEGGVVPVDVLLKRCEALAVGLVGGGHGVPFVWCFVESRASAFTPHDWRWVPRIILRCPQVLTLAPLQWVVALSGVGVARVRLAHPADAPVVAGVSSGAHQCGLPDCLRQPSSSGIPMSVWSVVQ